MQLRNNLPLNGGTAFADTTAALAALDASERALLAKTMVRRRLNEGDEGWLAPLVRVFQTCACLRVCVSACVSACVRACVRMCACVCARAPVGVRVGCFVLHVRLRGPVRRY